MADVVRLCTEGDVPCGPINSIADIFADPHFAARGVLKGMHDDDARVGEVVVPDALPRLSLTPGEVRTLGPELGNWDDYVRETLINDDSELRDRDA